jgi:ribosomal protein L16 Arg81 hydroxylase
MIKKIECIKAISKNGFEKNYLNKRMPVIISSGLKWKAFKWTPNYFKNLFPNKLIDLEVNHSVKIKNKKYLKIKDVEKMSMKDVVDIIYTNKAQNIKYYLCQKSIYKEFPELIQDFEKPIWRNENEEYDEPAVNLWFGEAGNATPLHFDASHNFLVQIYGRKQVRLFKPEDTKYLYRHSHETKGPPHLSQILDIDNCDNLKYPQFKNATAYEAILSPQETLFIPAGWWHDIRSLDHAISINFWWKPKIQECLLSQILPLSVYDLLRIGRLNDMYTFFSELNIFKNDLETANNFIDNENYCLAILFMANFFLNKLKSISNLLNISHSQKNILDDIQNINQSILLIDKNLGISKKTLFAWLDLIEKTKDEKFLFEKGTLISMYEKLQSFSNKIEEKLINDNVLL